MSVILLPRLHQITVDQLIDDLIRQPDSFMTFSSSMEKAFYAASGGSAVPEHEIKQLRDDIVVIAEKHGFPIRGGIKERAAFDREMTVYLAKHHLLIEPEALRDDVWAFITTSLVPDVVRWRFPKLPRERFHGGVRNALQRLWLRSKALDRGEDSPFRWELVETLTEDAFVQITERPSIGSDHRLALALSEGWLRTSQKIGRGEMEGVMRGAIVFLRLRNQIQLLSCLSEDELTDRINEAFERAKVSVLLG